MRYSIGDKVIHRRNGVAVINGLTEMSGRSYFVLNLIKGEDENIYVPIEGAENIIRKIMNKDEADALLIKIKDIKVEFNSNTKQRRDAYKRKLSSGDINEIAPLLKQYYLYKKEPDKYKLGVSDIDMITYATNNLLDELSITYDISREEIERFVGEKIK